MSAEPPFKILATLDTGPLTNHVALVENAAGKFAYISIGAENVVKVFRRDERRELVATIPTGNIPRNLGIGRWNAGLCWPGESGYCRRWTRTNTIIATIPIGQQPQALVYVPDAVPNGDGSANLTPLGDTGKAAHLKLAPPQGNDSWARATVSVN